MPRRDATRPANPPTPPAWQTAVTVLLIVHLFCLALGLAVNLSGGKSMLAPALFRIPGVRTYLKLLWMDVGYDFYVASPLPEDGSHTLRLSADERSPQPAIDALPALMPVADMQPRIRRQRYQQLAYHVAFLDELYAENSDIRTELPLAIAEQWLRELHAPHEPYVLTCTREPSARLPKAIERAPGKVREGGPRMAGPATFAPETITVYLVWDPEENRYQGSRAEPVGQTSEVVRATPGPINTAPGEPASAGGSPLPENTPTDSPTIPGLPTIPPTATPTESTEATPPK
jgi:hypothetical protein